MHYMRIVVCALVLVFGGWAALSPQIALADEFHDSFKLNDQDKQLHMAASYGVSLSATRFLEVQGKLPRWESVLLASLFTLTAGTIKETLIDEHYSWGDQTANLIGTSTSALFVFTFSW